MATCLREHKGNCRGEVTARPSFAGTGTMINECEVHFRESLDFNDRLRRVYPDSPVAPSWFDEGAAGERWDSDY